MLLLLAACSLHAQERSWKTHDVDYQQVYIDSAKALKADPNDIRALQQRAFAWLGVGRDDMAIAAYNDVMQRDPTKTKECLCGRGHAYEHKGEYEKAIADFEACGPQARLALAWLLATCPQDNLRDGKRALELIENIKFAKNYPPALDALAAAYAETGDFEKAIALEKQLIDLSIDHGPSTKAVAVAKSHLALYEAHKPYHAKRYFFPDFL
jgi:tetratricopeptide (TPR) repeat protein